MPNAAMPFSGNKEPSSPSDAVSPLSLPLNTKPGATVAATSAATTLSEAPTEKTRSSSVEALEVPEATSTSSGLNLASDEPDQLMDLSGPSWTWPNNDRELGALVKSLGAKLVPQPAKGAAVLQSKANGVQNMGQGQGPAGPGAYRIEGGAGSLCKRLIEAHKLDVRLLSRVETIEIEADANVVRVSTRGGPVFCASAVVLAVPPRSIAADIGFFPALGDERRKVFQNTQTWMADAGKFCLLFEDKFWQKAGLSGTVFANGLPAPQVWDNSDGAQAALAGFVFGSANLRHLDSESAFAASPLLTQLEQVFGPRVRSYQGLELCAWDRHFPADESASGGNHDYGSSLLQAPHAQRIFFGSTETTPDEHGHMEGAVQAGIRTSQQVLALLRGTPRK
ncbi:Amine oxidase flavin-containing [Hondaea fermentalgiana]|uniref:monoamine oxidase n=1 Tax=Hondaea fermentalgiana TaxID=2315210 RepID=A0A2R5GPX1_9STRA|nr:Amine oxidase flavin-containing [Hondaea fermentalgiana]|eukprot:GBG32926.1 Amine oxidase flavin-containing [Hondaea fermentalgiana]